MDKTNLEQIEMPALANKQVPTGNGYNVTRDKISGALKSLIQLFESDRVPEALAICTFPRFEVPSQKWSFCNRLLMFLAGTADARGIRQWNTIGRRIKKGSKSFYIFAPIIIERLQENDPDKSRESKNDDEEDSKRNALVGFRAIPVFRVEDTDGRKLDYEEIKIPEFPLIEVARKWGIDVSGIPYQGRCFGYFSPGQIGLASPEETIFFHELAHAAHQRVKGKLKSGQDPMQEVAAELSAQTLARLIGTSSKNTLGNSVAYIKAYAKREEQSLSAGKMCMAVLADVEKILHEIFSL